MDSGGHRMDSLMEIDEVVARRAALSEGQSNAGRSTIVSSHHWFTPDPPENLTFEIVKNCKNLDIFFQKNAI